MKPDELEDLANSINDGYCILFLGPQLTTENINGIDIPLTDILAKQLCEKTGDDINIDYHNNLMKIAQQCHFHMKEGKLKNAIAGFYKKKNNMPIPKSLLNVASIPFRFIIYSTQDNLLLRAFQEKNKKPHYDFYNFSGQKPGLVKLGTVDEPLIYHLYGHTDEPSSIVVSENSILEFIVSVIKDVPGLPPNIQSTIKSKNTCFLFLGFGLNNWYLKIIIHSLFSSIIDNWKIAFEQLDSLSSKEFEQMVLFYENDYNLKIYNEDQNNFIEELKVECAKLSPPDKTTDLTKKLFTTTGSSPRVFISYARENTEYAKNIYEQLRVKGFKPWIDKENIYGGDEWDERIDEVINKEVDYFIFLQSKQMELQSQSYFYKELKKAKDRDENCRPGINFIIPVKIEECNDVVKLENRHCINLFNMSNIDELVTAINKDYQLRKRDNL